MASELESLGADISGPLWSAHVLEDTPEKVLDVHRSYLAAGADVLLTASYQVSRHGYIEAGLSPAQADQALLRSVELACRARDEARDSTALIAASLGPYGAALHNGAEYHGNYDCTFQDLVDFHQDRIAVLAASKAGCQAYLLAFETLPSLEEAIAIGHALSPWPELKAWFTFTCPDPQAASLKVAHGELLRDCARMVAGLPQTIAIGVNCTHPGWISNLIGELRKASDKPIVIYPNSGEGWNAQSRCWTGSGDPALFGSLAAAWYAQGAQLVGGCCRTGPGHIRQVAEAARLSFK